MCIRDRFHHDDGVEFQSVGQIDGEEAERRAEAVTTGVDGVIAGVVEGCLLYTSRCV